jgi:DNA-binding CsgD family transcriptional regulator
VGAARPGARGELPELITDGLGAGVVRELRPGGLTLGATRELLFARLGFAPSHQLLVRIQDVSRGNPYFALELARALDEHRGPIGEQLPVPNTLRRLVHGRVARLPRRVRHVLLAAALAPGASIAMLDASLPDPVAAYLETAEDAGVIDLGSGRVSFTHPLLRSVVVADAPVREQRETHRQLAAGTANRTERARHLARAADGPDAEVAAALDDAAAESRLRGAVEFAAELGELAVTLTPPGDAEHIRSRSLAAAEYQFECGSPGRARELAEPYAADGATLALLAKYQRYCGDPMDVWTATLRRALDVAEDDPLRAAIHIDLGMAATNAGNMRELAPHLEAVRALAARPQDPLTTARIASTLLYADFMAGRGIDESLVAPSLVQPSEPSERLATEVRPSYTLAVAFNQAGELGRARELLDREYAAVLAQGDEASLPIVLSVLTRVEVHSGNIARAADLAEQGVQAADLSGIPAAIAFMASARSTVHAVRGDVVAALDDSRRAVAIGTELSLAPVILPAVEAVAQLELARGDAAAALAQVAPYLDLVPLVEPGFARIVPEGAEALVRLGRLDEADARLTPFEACAAERGRGWAQCSAGRVRGLLLAASGDLAGAEAVLEQAIAQGAASTMPLETARTVLVAGEVDRRARHRARANARFDAATATFAALGARLWIARCDEERARAQLHAGSVTDPQALTETERRVAELAADGRSSREIAATLFTGVRTVEAHLQHVYRKLGVHSRIELSRRLGR